MLKNFQFSAYKIHLSRTIRQILLNDSAKVNLMPVLQQILLDEKCRGSFKSAYSRFSNRTTFSLYSVLSNRTDRVENKGAPDLHDS